MAALALAMLLPSLGVSIASAALPTFAEAFGAGFEAAQGVVLAYLTAVTVLIVFAGRLGDLFGRRRVLLGGMMLFTGASVLCGLASSLGMLLAARALQGAGAAALMALTIASVRESVPKDRIGSAMGLLGTMSAVGTALGPALGGLIVAGAGWRSLFLGLVPLGLLAEVLAWRFLPVSRPKSSSGKGTARAPILDVGVLRERGLGRSMGMNALVAAVIMSTMVVGPFYLSGPLGLDAVRVGLVLAIGPVLSALTGVPSGRLVDRFGAATVVKAGLTAMAVGCLGLALLPGVAGLAGYVAGIVVLTPGYQLFQAANNTAVMADVADSRRGTVSGFLSLSRNLGLITGASAMGAVFALATGAADVTAALPAAVETGRTVAFGVAAGLIGVALALAVTGRDRAQVDAVWKA